MKIRYAYMNVDFLISLFSIFAIRLPSAFVTCPITRSIFTLQETYVTHVTGQPALCRSSVIRPWLSVENHNYLLHDTRMPLTDMAKCVGDHQ